tara:strand:+ start:370 stop:846 length:477 start_codon:yes stop_codon:yes gene_type:complete
MANKYISTKVIPLGSTAFRQWKADSHCKFIHGYRLTAKVWLTAPNLDERNWVFDFGGFKNIKKILENQFDHTTLIARDDPELGTFKVLDSNGLIQLRVMEQGCGIEKFAEWIYKTINDYLFHNYSDEDKQIYTEARVIKVEVWEHNNNSAIYEGDYEF